MSLTSINVSAFDTLGYVTVSWNNTGKSGTFETWRVYRRDLDTAGPWVLVDQTTGNASTDYLAPPNRSLEYAVVEVLSGNVEENYNDTMTATAVSTNYWLVHDDTSLTFRLEHVTSDSFDDEYEEETIPLIGRGRKKEVGTRWGYTGSLEASIRPKNGKTGLQQKTELEQFKIRQGEGDTYIRSPFGEVFKASLGALGWDRLEGSGTEPWFSVSIPYEEVY